MSAAKNKANTSDEDKSVALLSEKESVVLQMLCGRRQMYGQEMVDSSEGQLGRGTIYVTLNRMEDKGYIESWREEPTDETGVARRAYKATGAGMKALRAWEVYRSAMHAALAGVRA